MSRQSRNPQETQRKILDAALTEFAANGFKGARLDRILADAGVNRRMIYHYFDDKEGLFRAVLEREMAVVSHISDTEPGGSPLEISLHWADNLPRLANFIRLTLWGDSLHDDADPVLVEERVKSFAASRDILAKMQQTGQVPPDIDPAYYLLALTSLTTLPTVMPGMTKIITGDDPDTDEFREKFTAVLKAMLPG